jgi:hypothetical protein
LSFFGLRISRLLRIWPLATGFSLSYGEYWCPTVLFSSVYFGGFAKVEGAVCPGALFAYGRPEPG